MYMQIEEIQMKRNQKIKIWHIIAAIGLLMCLLFGYGFRTMAGNAYPKNKASREAAISDTYPVPGMPETREIPQVWEVPATTLSPATPVPDAAAILAQAAAVYENANGLTAAFTLRTHSEATRTTESFEGTIDMKGDKFVLNTPDMVTWFDGRTQWTYVGRNDEVNVSTPTGDELQFTNPALLLRTYQKGFTPSYKGESTAPNGKAAYEIELTPKKKGDILKVNLQIEKLTHYPASITLEGKNGLSHTIRISKLKTNINQPDDFFVFKEADFPDAEIIDLR